METHVKILAVLFIALSCLGLVAALVMMAVTGGITGLVAAAAQDEPDAVAAAPIVGMILGFISILIAVIAVPGIIAGVGLLKYREWARVLAIVLSGINLLNVPVGTILGAYGLWVLLSNETVQLFRTRRAVASGGFR